VVVRSKLAALTLIESIPKAPNFRVIGRRFAADPDMAMVALGAGDGEPQLFQHARVALVEIERDNVRIAIDAQCQLRQIAAPIEKPSNNCAKASVCTTLLGISHMT
jgi:hypothetical protein